MRQHGRLAVAKKDKMLAGVIGGLAEYFNVSSTTLRVIAVVLQFTGAPIILAYMALAMWMKGPVHEWTKRKFHQVMAEKMNREKSADFEDVEDPLDHVVHEKDKEWSDF